MTTPRRAAAIVILCAAATLFVGAVASRALPATADRCHHCGPKPTPTPPPRDPEVTHKPTQFVLPSSIAQVNPPSTPDGPTGTPGPAVGTLITPHAATAWASTVPAVVPHPAGGDATLVMVVLTALGVLAVGAITVSVALR